MRGRDQCKGAPSTDLLVCFPSRAHLSLMPKPICSPARPSEPNKQRSHHHLHRHKRSFSRGGGGGPGGQASPLLWSKSKQMGSDISEPTSPKVTCAGQIKVRPRPRPGTGSCKNWRSVMEEIEKLHNERKQKRPSWVEALGIKKDAMQFLACLRNIRFDFRCFGSFPTPDITSDDDEEEDEDEEASRTVFSKWFMVLQENQGNGVVNKDKSISVKEEENYRCDDNNENEQEDDEEEEYAPSAPPSNALLLMRCRSAPAKSWLEEREEEEKREEDERKEKLAMEKEEEELEMKRKKKRENLVVMRYYENNNDFYKISSDIAKETWVVGGIKDPISRSRSCKR